MTKYDIMFEAIQDRYDNGELTFEQAKELNSIAYDKYVTEAYSEYSKEEEDKFLKSYQEKVDKLSVIAKDFCQAYDNKDSVTKAQIKSLLEKTERALNDVLNELDNAPYIMSSAALKRAPKYGDIIRKTVSKTILANGVYFFILKKFVDDDDEKKLKNKDTIKELLAINSIILGAGALRLINEKVPSHAKAMEFRRIEVMAIDQMSRALSKAKQDITYYYD